MTIMMIDDDNDDWWWCLLKQIQKLHRGDKDYTPHVIFDTNMNKA
jgi:hypothetical protein